MVDRNPAPSREAVENDSAPETPVLLAANSKTSPTWTSPLAFVAAGNEVSACYQGRPLACSRDVIIVHEQGHRPVFYFPREDVQLSALTAIDRTSHCPRKGDASYFEVTGSGAPDGGAAIAWTYEDPIPMAAILKNHIAFYLDNVDLSRKT